ncbi:hypothetical protein, partial [Stutzerimonas stutzeri]|uniref:hypothetical protein n=1 Tax=Stutzerimonas stutzeri TaxID=316 RepID=UPI0024B71459
RSPKSAISDRLSSAIQQPDWLFIRAPRKEGYCQVKPFRRFLLIGVQVRMRDKIRHLRAAPGKHIKSIVIHSGAAPTKRLQGSAGRRQPRIPSQLVCMLLRHLRMAFIRKA